MPPQLGVGVESSHFPKLISFKTTKLMGGKDTLPETTVTGSLMLKMGFFPPGNPEIPKLETT